MTDSALSQPLYGASFGEAVKRFFAKFATFSGRASLSEYWWVYLFVMIINVIMTAIFVIVLTSTGEATETGVRGTGPELVPLVIWGIIGLVLIIPIIAITIRRLHDANFSGWMYLLNLIPSVGGLIVLILTILPSNPLGSRFDR